MNTNELLTAILVWERDHRPLIVKALKEEEKERVGAGG